MKCVTLAVKAPKKQIKQVVKYLLYHASFVISLMVMRFVGFTLKIPNKSSI